MRRLLLLLVLLALVSCRGGSRETVHFFNWSEYLPEEILAEFARETGIRVVYTTYDSNEAMYAKVKLLGGGGYDLAVPSTYYVSKMRQEGLLQPLDRSRLGNFRHLDPQHLDLPFDPGNECSVPYLWGSTGLAVNTRLVDPEKVRSWADLWRPEFRGQVLLTNDQREVFHMALRVLGYSGNSTDPEELRQAYEKLLELLPSVRLFNSDSPRIPYLAGEVAVGMIWNGEAFRAREEDPDIRFVYPREGAILWMDSLVIPRGAKNVENAHKLIDFLLRPEIARRISEEIGYASPNREAVQALDPQIREDRSVYPATEDLTGAEYQVDIGEAIVLYERYWERLKAGR